MSEVERPWDETPEGQEAKRTERNASLVSHFTGIGCALPFLLLALFILIVTIKFIVDGG